MLRHACEREINNSLDASMQEGQGFSDQCLPLAGTNFKGQQLGMSLEGNLLSKKKSCSARILTNLGFLPSSIVHLCWAETSLDSEPWCITYRCGSNLTICFHREASKERDKKREKEEKKRLELERKEQKEKEKKEQELKKKFKVRACLSMGKRVTSFCNSDEEHCF
jgi:hypothetical protein